MLPKDTLVTSEDEGTVLRKQQKYFLRCKETAWRKFHRNYLVVLREQHNLNHKDKLVDIQIGDVVIIKGESKNRWYWELAIVEKLHSRKDNVIRAVGFRTTDTVIVPNGITLPHRDKIESKFRRV